MFAALFLVVGQAGAAELVWDGFYRFRFQLDDSLSLADEAGNTNAEGLSVFTNHRLSLRPTWLLSEHASVHAQLDLLPYTTWGATPATGIDPTSGDATAMAFSDGVTSAGLDIANLRAWGEVETPIGRFAAGRMPMEWGTGILWSAGNDPGDEYGDTTDRLQFSNNFGQVWVLGAYDVQAEGFLNAPDDMQSLSAAVGYKDETSGAGLLASYRFQPSLGWQQFTGDLFAATQMGPLDLKVEGVGEFGSGDLETGANNIKQMAFGAMLAGRYEGPKLNLGVEAGFASGDADPDDASLHTFAFDADHDVGLILFEETLPTLAATVATEANGGRTTEAALSTDGVSNALYLRPAVGYQIRPDLGAELAWLFATHAKAASDTSGRAVYGNELDVTLRYEPYPHVRAEGAFGVFLPGKYYSLYEDEDWGTGFDKPAFAGRLIGTVEF